MDCDQELSQLQRLHDLKHKGFSRQSPAAAPVKNKAKCLLCDEVDTDDNLRKHVEAKHSGGDNIEKKSGKSDGDGSQITVVNTPRNSNEAVKARIPLINSLDREYNCLECDFQASGKGSSKALLRHAKQSKHKTSPLEEKCFSCQELCSNFEELMIHRREKHSSSINLCRYLSEGSCKFGDRCWYSHDPSRSRDGNVPRASAGFQEARQPIPPDMMQGLTVLLSDLIAKHLEKKKSPGV